MERAMFPLKYLKILSSDHGGNSFSFGHQVDKENVYAPFTGIIRKVYKVRGNFVWLESMEKVLWADGTVDFMTILTGHDENVESLYVGKVIKKGEPYYTQGGNGSYFDFDVYIEVGKGKFRGNGWSTDEKGEWVIHNQVSLLNAFFVDQGVTIDENSNIGWKVI